MEQEKKYNIFISYCREDIEIVKVIKKEIEHLLEVTCWMDLDGIEAGTPSFTDPIIQAINSCPIFLFMLSAKSQESENAKKELDFAYRKHKNEGKKVVIVYVEQCKMNDSFSFDYSKADTIDWAIRDQKKKLLRDIKLWTREVNKRKLRSSASEHQQAPETRQSQQEACEPTHNHNNHRMEPDEKGREYKSFHVKSLRDRLLSSSFYQIISSFLRKWLNTADVKSDEDIPPQISNENLYAVTKEVIYTYSYPRDKSVSVFILKENGTPLFKSESTILAESISNKYTKKNLIINNEGTLYYIGNGCVFKLIEGVNVNVRPPYSEYSEYSIEIHQNKYILYRHNREYKLFEINIEESIPLKCEFQSKVVFIGDNVEICGKYIKKKEYVVDMTDGSFTNENVILEKELTKEVAYVETNIIKCETGRVFLHNLDGEEKVIYQLIEGETFIGSNSTTFAIGGYSYIEKYNHKGDLIGAITTSGRLSNVKLWENGFISARGGYFDREGIWHPINHSFCCTTRGWYSSTGEIVEIYSDNCFLIKELLCKGRTENEFTFLVDGKGGLLTKHYLDDVNRRNYYGSFKMERIDDKHGYCSFSECIHGNQVYFHGVINIPKGVVIIEKERSRRFFEEENLYVIE